MMAIIAAHHAGVQIKDAIQALTEFKNVKRRMEIKGQIGHTKVYDDFAHHPTAIKTTVEGLRANVGEERIIAILEPRSNTMKMGIHKQHLTAAWAKADEIFIFMPDSIQWSVSEIIEQSSVPVHVFDSVDELVQAVVRTEHAVADVPLGKPDSVLIPNQHILVMSNGGFDGIHGKLLAQLGKTI